MESSQNINEEADHNRDWERWKEKVEGIKFRPTAEVLAGHYLAGKVSGSTDGPIFPLIQEVDVYQYEPSKLESKAYDFGDGKMYFFSHIKKKYKKGLTCDRIAEGGCWMPGKRYDVSDYKDDRKIATETPLTYYRNDPESGKPTIRTHWLMKEYMLLEGQNDEEPKTLCVVYSNDKKRRQRESKNEVLYDNENNQSSLPDMEEPEGSASCTAENKNLLNMSTSEIHPGFSRKRQRSSSDCSNYNPPLIHLSSNPEAVTLEQTLPSYYSCPTMPNIGSWVNTADQSNVFTPGPNCNPPLYSTPNPAAVTLEEDMTDIINGSWGSIATAMNNNLPLYKSNSKYDGWIFGFSS